jgi:hypothetical protein
MRIPPLTYGMGCLLSCFQSAKAYFLAAKVYIRDQHTDNVSPCDHAEIPEDQELETNVSGAIDGVHSGNSAETPAGIDTDRSGLEPVDTLEEYIDSYRDRAPAREVESSPNLGGPHRDGQQTDDALSLGAARRTEFNALAAEVRQDCVPYGQIDTIADLLVRQ